MSFGFNSQIVDSEKSMLELGATLGRSLLEEVQSSPQSPIAIELVGDVGAGKTTLVRGIGQGLGIQGEITSPSFTICRKYAFPGGILSHYDFYRLPEPGIMSEEIAETLGEPGAIVLVEWGESVTELLPDDHLVITIELLPDGSRKVQTKKLAD